MSLRDLEPGRGTSLTDAMIDAVRQLQKYNCIRYNIVVCESAHYHCILGIGNTHTSHVVRSFNFNFGRTIAYRD